MSTDRFRTKKGRLTWYALTCGYIDVYEKDNIRTSLWHEGACYHIRSTDFNTVTRLSWDTAQTVGEAYKIFAQHKRMFHKRSGHEREISQGRVAFCGSVPQ